MGYPISIELCICCKYISMGRYYTLHALDIISGITVCK